MSQQICLTALMTLPKEQQQRMVKRLQEANQQQSNSELSSEGRFSKEQLAELTDIAKSIVEAANLERQSRDDAWAGQHSDTVAEDEIHNEVEALKEKVIRLEAITEEDGWSYEHRNTQERLRMLHLESCDWIKYQP
ncbi:MAG: hypothetical protein GQ475_04705 [Methylococcaceae bacterium]|nr:hypothetical protein [Methylococcaceae bacterium]